MIKNKVAGAVLGSLLLVGVTAPAVAAEPLDNPVTEDTNTDDEGGFDDWGLLGLLGLLGLAGLKKHKHDDVVTTRRETGTGSTSSTNR